jgi:UDP-glucuronate 4-epimerase
MRVLVTGAAGFIGFHLSCALARRAETTVLGFDNFNAYYDVRLKERRARLLKDEHGVDVVRGDLSNEQQWLACADAFKPTHIVNLAAQAGVRYSLDNPRAYVEANISGFLNVLEYCRAHANDVVLTYASSSSVYGLSGEIPFSLEQRTDAPASLYGATKKANELMAHSYAHLFGVRSAGLRFFTVYGPWGRPDMAVYIFTRQIDGGEPIDLFNNGDMLRDFTYVDDIVDGIIGAMERAPDYAIYNLGNSNAERLGSLVDYIEQALGKTAERRLKPMQAGDVKETFADVSVSERELGFRPKVGLQEGVRRFVAWYKAYAQV